MLLHLAVLLPAGVQPVGGDKIRVTASQIPGFLIHQGREALHASAHMLRDHYGRVVVRFQHQAVEQILQPEGLPLIHAQMDLRLSRRILGCGHGVREISIFQGYDTGHNLRRTCHGTGHALIFPIQDSACFRVHQNSRLCIQPQFILLILLFLPIRLRLRRSPPAYSRAQQKTQKK